MKFHFNSSIPCSITSTASQGPATSVDVDSYSELRRVCRTLNYKSPCFGILLCFILRFLILQLFYLFYFISDLTCMFTFNPSPLLSLSLFKPFPPFPDLFISLYYYLCFYSLQVTPTRQLHCCSGGCPQCLTFHVISVRK